MPSVVSIDFGVQVLKLQEAALVELPAGHFLVLLEQRVDFAQPSENDIANRQVEPLWQVLV